MNIRSVSRTALALSAMAVASLVANAAFTIADADAFAAAVAAKTPNTEDAKIGKKETSAQKKVAKFDGKDTKGLMSKELKNLSGAVKATAKGFDATTHADLATDIANLANDENTDAATVKGSLDAHLADADAGMAAAVTAGDLDQAKADKLKAAWMTKHMDKAAAQTDASKVLNFWSKAAKGAEKSLKKYPVPVTE